MIKLEKLEKGEFFEDAFLVSYQRLMITMYRLQERSILLSLILRVSYINSDTIYRI